MIETHQKAVDDMATAITAVENRCESALVEAGRLPGKIRAFRTSCDLHATCLTQAQAKAASAVDFIGEGLAMLGQVHDDLECIRQGRKLPDVSVQSGGGGK